MSISYNANVPAANNNPSVDQPQMLINTMAINQWTGVDHFNFASPNAGLHNQATLISQGAIPPGRPSSSGTLYVKTLSRSQLFYTNSASGNEYQLTRVTDSNFPLFATNTNYQVGPPSLTGGWTFLPGNMFLQYGTVTCNTGTTVTFPVAFSTAVYSVQCTIFQPTTNRHFVYAQSANKTGFVTTNRDSSGNDETNTFTWIAIGV